MYHTGMSEVLPYKQMVPRVGKRVIVSVGEVVPLDDLFGKCACRGGSRPEVWMAMAQRLEDHLRRLEAVHPERGWPQPDVPPKPRRNLS